MKSNLKFSPETKGRGSRPRPQPGEYFRQPDLWAKLKSKMLPTGTENAVQSRPKGWNLKERGEMNELRATKEPVELVRQERKPSPHASPEIGFGPSHESSLILRLTQENSLLRKQNDYFKRYARAAKNELRKARDRIAELEHAVSKLRLRQNSRQSEEIAEEDNVAEEVKQEIPAESVTELARRLNCDSANPEEMRSLELALQLEAEERQRQVEETRHSMERLLSAQQDVALRALDNDPNGAVQVNPDVMTYEQLLELEEKIGSVSKGLSEDETLAIPTKVYSAGDNAEKSICSICQSEFGEGDTVKTLKCKHEYHADCINPWLRKNRACPICKECAVAKTQRSNDK